MNEMLQQEDFWDNKWSNNQTGWDIGYASPAIVDYFEKYDQKDAKILIPGCGNAHEALALLALGYRNITLLDIATTAVEHLKNKFQNTENISIIKGDFFQHQEQYDIIIEQTFFCAIPTNWRENYVTQAYNLLRGNGKIVGLLFNTEFEKQGPPFGGNTSEYMELFQNKFDVNIMETCYNSIAPRSGKELFVNLTKK